MQSIASRYGLSKGFWLQSLINVFRSVMVGTYAGSQFMMWNGYKKILAVLVIIYQLADCSANDTAECNNWWSFWLLIPACGDYKAPVDNGTLNWTHVRSSDWWVSNTGYESLSNLDTIGWEWQVRSPRGTMQESLILGRLLWVGD